MLEGDSKNNKSITNQRFVIDLSGVKCYKYLDVHEKR